MIKPIKDLRPGERFFVGPHALPDPDGTAQPPHWTELRVFRELATREDLALPDDSILGVWCDQVTGCAGSTGILLYPPSARVQVQPSAMRRIALTSLEELAEVLAASLVCALYWPALLWAGGAL